MHRVVIVVACLLAMIMHARLAQADQAPQATVYYGGSVFTARSNHVDASWFVVREGQFVEVGSGGVPERWQHARLVDLGGRFVMPGFIESRRRCHVS